jgi:hypothetical protein
MMMRMLQMNYGILDMNKKFNPIQMKNIRIILGAILIASTILVSCGQNSNKQNELELKERELALKEKELALKEKVISVTDSVIQKKEQLQKTQTAIVKLVVNPIKNDGDGFGQITFSQNDKLLIYFTQKTQKGKIVVNGDSYTLTSCSNDNSLYKLSGNDVTIIANNLIDEGSGDCFHYKCPKLNITLNGVTTTINNIVIQDCLSFTWE